MKLFAPALIFCGAAFGQSPQVPHKMQFAGMTLTIRDDARRDIQKDVDALTQHPKYFNIKAERARTYFPIIEKIFEEERLPDDFKFLALQESALVPDAVSSSNAVGFWQFKDFTAQEMGLRVDKEVDERMNITSASRGAARYLKQCNHYFNNWLYALQSYQMGAGGVMRAVGNQDLGTRHMEITPDTYWYVRKFLAHKIAFEDATHGKPAIEVTNVYAAGKSLHDLAEETSVDELKLHDFNKWLKVDRIPSDKEYAVIVPRGEGLADFGVLAITPKPTVTVLASTSITQTPESLEINGIAVVRANKGDVLTSIAERGKISISEFLHYNEMSIDTPIQSGQLYFLGKKKKKGSTELYTVQAGEDLWTVSQRFGIQEKFLKKYNDLDKQSNLSPGLTLYLSNRKPSEKAVDDNTTIALLNEDDSFNWDQPAPKKVGGSVSDLPTDALGAEKNPGQVEEINTSPASQGMEALRSDSHFHQVKASDTLYSVARQYGVSIKELMEWNDKKDFSLSVGEKLKVRSR